MKLAEVCQRVERNYIRGVRRVKGLATISAKWSGEIGIDRSNRFVAFACSMGRLGRSEEHTSELQSLMRISYAVFCLKKTYHNKVTISNIIHELTQITTQYQ